jgi:hypothetical protein
MARVRLDVGETVAIQDDFSLEFFLIVELALAMGKPANRGRSYDAVSAVCPVQAPLMRFRVIEP